MGYVRNAWYVASWAHELAVDKPLPITILNDRVVVWRTQSGGLHALEDRCVHRLAALSLGRCEGERLRCMYHGLLFDSDGKVVEIPGQSLIPPGAKVRTFPVLERYGWIWVWMGDAAAADPELIPEATGLEHPDYVLFHGQLDYDAEARLINDNLLDFSHLSYVHANSFNTGSVFANTPPKISLLPRGIRYERWIEGDDGGGGGATNVDLHQTYDYLIPGILLMWFGTFPPGTASKLNHGAPRPDDATGFFQYSAQAVTPMTDRTARYFFAGGPTRRLGGDEAERDRWQAIGDVAFAEDKTMIEEQQRVIDATPNPVVMPTIHDRAVVMFNRLVQSMVEAENAKKVDAA